MGKEIRSVTRKEIDRIKRERSFNHHIPSALIDELVNLKKVRYRKLLREFRSKYAPTKFMDLEEEYEFVKEEICALMNFTFSEPFVDVVEKVMRAAIAETNFEGAVREKFIHPFQIFLLGTIIIDHFYEKFRTWFSDKLCQSKKTCVESSWLLASIFHDSVKTLTPFKGLVEFMEGRIEIIIPDENEYIKNMTSLYNHLSAGHSLKNWSPASVKDSLRSILKEYSEADNHGVRSSFALFKHLRSAFKKGAFHPSYVEAALSIAVHDHALHEELLKSRIFPLDITLFPIPCLLLYCDAVQEWGRKTTFDTETRLVEVKIVENNVHCEVVFNQSQRAFRKIEEIDNVKRCIQSSGNIDFTFGPRVHVSI